MPIRRAGLLLAVFLAVLVAAPAARAQVPPSFPAAGDMLVERLAVRTAPSAGARIVTTLRAVRRDGRLQIVHAFASATDASGQAWLRIRPPIRPNNRTGWVLADRSRFSRSKPGSWST